MFHKTIHKIWNFFNLSEQPLEKFCRKFNFRISIDRKVLSINRLLFSIDRTGIDQRSNQAEAPRFFLYHFNQSSQSFDRSKMLNPKFSLYETIFSKLKTTLLQPILVYTYIYNKSYKTTCSVGFKQNSLVLHVKEQN